MYYDALSQNTVKITLSESDMRRYSLKKEMITGRTAEYKRSMTRFLKKFQSESSMLCGFSADRLFLEAFPSDEGGCVLYVSTLCEREKREELHTLKNSAVLMCGGLSLSDTAILCEKLLPICGEAQSRLIEYCGSYAVILHCSEREKEKLCRVMSEYGTVTDTEEEIVSAEEHGKTLAARDAVRIMSELY